MISNTEFNVAADIPKKDQVISSQVVIFWLMIWSLSFDSDWDLLISIEHPGKPGRIFCSIPTCQVEKNNPTVNERVVIQQYSVRGIFFNTIKMTLNIIIK